MRRTFCFLLGLLMAVGLANQAFAHAHLVNALPAENASVSAPETLRLKFSEGLELAFTGLALSGATGPTMATVATGAPALAAGDDTTLVVAVKQPLAAGAYTVAWHALSKDGHKTQGSYRFTVKP